MLWWRLFKKEKINRTLKGRKKKNEANRKCRCPTRHLYLSFKKLKKNL